LSETGILLALLDTGGWLWIVVLAMLVIAGYFFLDKLMRKGVYEEGTEGRSRLNSALSEMQTLVDPAHRHVMEQQERNRAEDDEAADGKSKAKNPL
jgi:hypothetical protein